MFDALDERSETIAGTALIGLELLSRDHEEFDRELLNSFSLSDNKQIDAAARMALQKMEERK